MRVAGPQLSEEERSHLDGVVDALARCFEGRASRETVERSVDDSLAEFHDARITLHLPVLVERYAKRRLEALVGETEQVAVSRSDR
jgi:hypothetical protein